MDAEKSGASQLPIYVAGVLYAAGATTGALLAAGAPWALVFIAALVVSLIEIGVMKLITPTIGDPRSQFALLAGGFVVAILALAIGIVLRTHH